MAKKKSLIKRMIKLFKNMGVLTDFQITYILGKSGDSVRPSRIKLEQKGIIKRTNNKVFNKNGRKCLMYQYITKKGK